MRQWRQVLLIKKKKKNQPKQKQKHFFCYNLINDHRHIVMEAEIVKEPL